MRSEWHTASAPGKFVILGEQAVVYGKPAITLAVVIFLTAAMFTNLKFIHPTRTKRWRWLTLPMSLGWCIFAAIAAYKGFAEGLWAHWGLVVTSLYLTFAGIAQQMIPERK